MINICCGFIFCEVFICKFDENFFKMKKVLLSLAVVSLISLTACKDDKKATENQAAADSTQTEQPAQAVEEAPKAEAPADAAASTDVPKFADTDVQKFVDDYTAYIKDITAAASSKDMTKMAALSQKGQEWATKSAEIGKKLQANPEDAKKFAEYYQKLATEMQAAMTPK